MFKKGDVINAIPPKEYGEWSCLMFTEDAKPVHGNPLKYMGKARPVCQAYQDEPGAWQKSVLPFLQTSVSAERIHGEICGAL